MAALTGWKGYLGIRETDLAEAFNNPFVIDEYLERFDDRIDGQAHNSFTSAVRRRTDSSESGLERIGVLRTFMNRPPLLVGVGSVAASPNLPGVVLGSPVVAHKNAGGKAVGILRSRMVGACFGFRADHVAMLSGSWGPKSADRSSLSRDCRFLLDDPATPAAIAFEARTLLHGAPHVLAHRTTRPAPQPVRESRGWVLDVAPVLAVPSPDGGPLVELKLPIRIGSRVERVFHERDMVEFADDVDPVETEGVESAEGAPRIAKKAL